MTNLKLRARRLCRDVSCVTYVAYLTVSSRDHYSRCLCLRNVIFLGRGGEKGGAHLTPHEISDFFVFLHTQFFLHILPPLGSRSKLCPTLEKNVMTSLLCLVLVCLKDTYDTVYTSCLVVLVSSSDERSAEFV